MTSEPEKWSSLEEIAEHLGVSKDTIRNWIKKGVIPHRRIGKQYKFKISEVDAWVDSGKSAEIEWAADDGVKKNYEIFADALAKLGWGVSEQEKYPVRQNDEHQVQLSDIQMRVLKALEYITLSRKEILYRLTDSGKASISGNGK